MGEITLVQVDAFFDGLAAHQAKNWLEHEGITAFVEGANANSAMYIGSALMFGNSRNCDSLTKKNYPIPFSASPSPFLL